MRDASLKTLALALVVGASFLFLLSPADAKPPGSCEPWPECKGGEDGSGGSGGSDDAAFYEGCDDLARWTVSARWSARRGECQAKNTDAPHSMVTAGNIDLAGALDAHLSYTYRVENADPPGYLRIWARSDGGDFIELGSYSGTESGAVNLNLADYIALTSQVQLRATCFVSAQNEICAWDDITVTVLPANGGDLTVTVDAPGTGTYGADDFPLTYRVSLNQAGTVEYSLDGGPRIEMMSDPSSPGLIHTAVETLLPAGLYSFQAFGLDDLGHPSQSEPVVFTVGLVAPAIAFVSPTPPDGSSQSGSEINLALSTSAALDHYAFVDFGGDLLLWLRMDEVVGDLVIDSSGYGNDGVAEGHAVQNPAGRFGAAFEFDGVNHGNGTPTDRIVIPGFQDSYPIFDTSFTVMAWAKPDVNEKMVIIGTKSITNLPGWHLRTSGGSHRLRLGVNTGYTNETAAYAETSQPMQAGVWVHVVGVYDHTVPSISLYLDGVLIDTTVDGVSGTGYGNALELAVAVPEDPQKAWDGLVDEVLIFDRVLDADEIGALYDATATQFANAYTDLLSGFHDFIGYSVDAAGNVSQTELRTVTLN